MNKREQARFSKQQQDFLLEELHKLADRDYEFKHRSDTSAEKKVRNTARIWAERVARIDKIKDRERRKRIDFHNSESWKIRKAIMFGTESPDVLLQMMCELRAMNLKYPD